MKRLNLVIDDELDEQFRREVAKRMSTRKGNLQKAGAEALKMWIEAPKNV